MRIRQACWCLLQSLCFPNTAGKLCYFGVPINSLISANGPLVNPGFRRVWLHDSVWIPTLSIQLRRTWIDSWIFSVHCSPCTFWLLDGGDDRWFIWLFLKEQNPNVVPCDNMRQMRRLGDDGHIFWRHIAISDGVNTIYRVITKWLRATADRC